MILIDRKTGEKVEAVQYLQGEHPPPAGIKVTMGLRGVLARVDTLHGEGSVIYDKDWLIMTPQGRDMLTDSFVQNQYRREDEEEAEPDKPVRIG